jgi:hypothetical protein
MKKYLNDPAWKQVVARLNAAYDTLGRQGLEKMTGAEVHVLHAEKAIDLREAKAWMEHYPGDELGALRLQKAEHQCNDISAWMKEKSREQWKERGPEMER